MMTAQELLDSVNAAGVTKEEVTAILAGGKVTVAAARLKAQAARKRIDADATRQAEHEAAAELDAQAAALTAGLSS
jgi:hypothetical protein